MACEITTPPRAEEAAMMGISISCFMIEPDYTKGDRDVKVNGGVEKGARNCS